MYVSKSLEDILNQVNQTLPQRDRVSAEQIRQVGTQLESLLHEAQGPEYHSQSEPESLPEKTIRERLLAFWQQVKDKIAAWLAPICPRWRKLISKLKQILKQVAENTGQDTLLTAALVVIVVAVVAALINSLPLIVALLATVGAISLIRLLVQVTNPRLLLAR